MTNPVSVTNLIKTRLLLLSDTHSHAPRPADQTSHPYRWPLPEADVAIHTGDLTMTGRLSEHRQAIDLLKRIRAELKIVIPGNHDLTLDAQYYVEHGERHGPRPRYDNAQLQQIRDLYTGPDAQAANVVYLEEGAHALTLKNGAALTVYASAYTPEFCGWAFAYPHGEDRFNPATANNRVPSYHQTSQGAGGRNIDLMLTHGPPFGILDLVQDGPRVGCPHLLRAVSRAKPLLHCFGHIHEGWGALRKSWSESESGDVSQSPGPTRLPPRETSIVVGQGGMMPKTGVYVDATDMLRGSETLFVNSSIMTVNYKPDQSPWVVDLMLDKSV